MGGAPCQPRVYRTIIVNVTTLASICKESTQKGPMEHIERLEYGVSQSIKASIATKERLLNSPTLISTIVAVTEVLIDALSRDKKVLIFGNGGSAADAQHIAAEFVGRFAFDRPPLPALALSVNTSCLTAIGNDYGFEQVFARQIEALGCQGDVAIGISTSGNSPNVLCAMSTASRLGLHTIGVTGRLGGQLQKNVDYCINVPSDETPRIQECHILVGHIIAEQVEQTILHDQQSCVSRS